MNKSLIAAGLPLLALVGAAAFAQPASPAPKQPVPDQSRAELVRKLDERFAKIDVNHDGKITRDELIALRKERQDARFAKLDANKDGNLSRDEFEAPRGKMGGHRFRGRGFGGRRGSIDANRDGVITKDEFQSPALAHFDRIDADHNGIVTAAERKAAWDAMKAHRGRPRA